MPFNRLTRQQLVDRAASNIESRLGGVDARLRRNLVTVFATVLGLAEDDFYSYLDFLKDQIFADRSEAEFLLRDGNLYNLSPKLPSAATIAVSASGTDESVIPAGTVITRSDRATFTTTSPATLSGGAIVNATANVPGTFGNTAVGSTVNFTQPVNGVLSSAVVVAGGVAGNDAETIEQFRARVLARKRAPPQGGNANDYVNWATSLPGVTRAWAIPRWMGAGTVGVTFVMDARPNIIPISADVAVVQNFINSVRPIRGTAIVFAPTPVVLNPVIHLNPSNAISQAAVIAQLADLIAREATPGGTTNPNGTRGGLIYLTHIADAIGTAPGVIDYTLNTPAANVAVSPGQMTTLGTPTWI